MTETAAGNAPPPPPRSRRRELLGNLLLALASTSFFLVALEIVLRVAELAPTQSLAYPDLAAWEANPGPFLPGQRFVDRLRPRLPHQITINSLGFRGEDFPLRKAPGTYRILCLGDSYTFGDYVDDAETFPAALSKKLKEAIPGRPIEVINGGVNGYTITDEASFAEEKGFSLDPDAIVVGFVMNDLADLTRRLSSRENQRQEARRMSESALTPVKRVLRRTATYNLLFVLKAAVMGSLRLDPTVQDLPIEHLLHPPYDDRTEALFARYAEELSRLAALCRERGVSLHLVLFPYYEQVVEGASAEAQARMTRLAGEAGVPVIDLLPAFLRGGARAGRLFLMPLDHHPSPRGYRVAASAVARALTSRIKEARPAP